MDTWEDNLVFLHILIRFCACLFVTKLYAVSQALTLGLKINRYTLRANMDEAPRTDESADDMVAADTAPRPQNDT